MKTVEVTCCICNKAFNKAKNEYTRRSKLGVSVWYCSRICSGKVNIKSFGDKVCKQAPINGGWGGSRNKNAFKYYMNIVRGRHVEFDIDIDYLEALWEQQKGVCPYTGVNLTLMRHAAELQDPRFSASLDRLDSSKSYIKGNVQFVSRSINYMKNTMTNDQVWEFIKIISENYLLLHK